MKINLPSSGILLVYLFLPSYDVFLQFQVNLFPSFLELASMDLFVAFGQCSSNKKKKVQADNFLIM